MAWYHKLFNISEENTNIISEDIDAFKKLEEKQKEGISGEGFPANDNIKYKEFDKKKIGIDPEEGSY